MKPLARFQYSRPVRHQRSAGVKRPRFDKSSGSYPRTVLDDILDIDGQHNVGRICARQPGCEWTTSLY